MMSLKVSLQENRILLSLGVGAESPFPFVFGFKVTSSLDCH